MIEGQRVRRLRVLHGMTQTELADRVQLRQDRLSHLERGIGTVDAETAQLLAIEFGIDEAFLHRPVSAPLQALSPQFRARSKVTMRDRAAAMEWAQLIHDEYNRMARDISAAQKYPQSGDPATAADAMRERLGFSRSEPLPYLLLAVERLGTRILGLPFAVPTIDGFSAWHDERHPVIAVMTGVPTDRLRFTVAHELGHLVLHRDGESGQRAELEADQFAAQLLFPSAVAADVLPSRITLNALVMVKSHWGVSVKVLIRRAKELGIVDGDQTLSLYKQISKRGWNKKEPGFVPPEKPRGFRRLIEEIYGRGPNFAAFAADAGWSQELTLRILQEHASRDELPRIAAAPTSNNVVSLADRRGPAVLSGRGGG